MNKKRKYSRFLQTWSTNASNFRAKKILNFFGVSCDIYWQSYWSIFEYCYLSYWMFETNFWEVPSRFCIFGSVSERITWGEHPHQSMVLGHVHFKNTFFTECLQSENNTCWQKNLQQFQALFSMFVVKWCGKQKHQSKRLYLQRNIDILDILKSRNITFILSTLFTVILSKIKT